MEYHKTVDSHNDQVTGQYSVKYVLAESNSFNGREKCEVLLKRSSVKIFGCANIVVFVNLGTLLYLHLVSIMDHFEI